MQLEVMLKKSTTPGLRQHQIKKIDGEQGS